MDRIYHEPAKREEQSVTESLQQKNFSKRTDIAFRERVYHVKRPTLIQTLVVSSKIMYGCVLLGTASRLSCLWTGSSVTGMKRAGGSRTSCSFLWLRSRSTAHPLGGHREDKTQNFCCTWQDWLRMETITPLETKQLKFDRMCPANTHNTTK